MDTSPGAQLRREGVGTSQSFLIRYALALHPLHQPVLASLGETMTPLVERPWGGRTVMFKLDYLLATGSFKDRGAAMVINALATAGIRAIREDSSGNAGASYAAYCAAADVRCRVFVPATTSPAKLSQMRLHGAEVRLIAGPRSASTQAALRDSDGSYAGHNWHPLFIEGLKTIAFEIWEQSGWTAPDAVVAPIGAGNAILGLSRGFAELKASGAISRTPRVFAAESSNWPTFTRAAAQLAASQEQVRRDRESIHHRRRTAAEGLMISQPPRMSQVLRALRDCGGRAIAVTEAEIVGAGRDLAYSGLLVAPAAAVAGAAARHLIRNGDIADTESVAVLLTGSGLKTIATSGRLLAARS